MKLEPITTENRTLLRDESRLQGNAKAICWPETEEEAVQFIRETARQEEKLTFRGAATGLMGGAVPQEGYLMDLSRLTAMETICPGSKGCSASVLVQCGVALDELDRYAGAKGLCFPVGPTEKTATLGGVFASGAAGPNRLYYGAMSHFVQQLNWVTPCGEIWSIPRGVYHAEQGKMPLPDGRTLNLPSASMPIATWEEGMDLIDFLAGTEGYLGAALSMKLTLLPKPADLWGVVFFFEKTETALQFGTALLPQVKRNKEGSHITLAEFLDQTALKLLADSQNNPLLARIPSFPKNAAAAVYLELEAPQEGACAELLMELLDLFESLGGREEDTWSETGLSGVQKFRDMRHALPALLNEYPQIHTSELGCRWEMDLKGPEQQVESYWRLYRQELQQYQMNGAMYGHLLQNQLRVALLPNAENRQSCRQLVDKLARQAMEQGAVLASEYGIGRVKRQQIADLLTPQAKEQLLQIRQTLDPMLRMNP